MLKQIKVNNKFYQLLYNGETYSITDKPLSDLTLKDTFEFYRFETGSSGNFNVVTFNDDAIILDHGVSYNQASKYLASIGNPKICAIIISHIHKDHIHDDAKLENYNAPICRTKKEVQDLNLKHFKFEPYTHQHGNLESLGTVITVRDKHFFWLTDAGNMNNIPRYNYTKAFCEVNYTSSGLKSALDDGVYERPLVERIIRDHLNKQQVEDWCINRHFNFDDLIFPLHMSKSSMDENIGIEDYYSLKIDNKEEHVTI